MHLVFLEQAVFRALFVLYRARVRVGCMGIGVWDTSIPG
jgi:hypothetical protein